MLLHSIGQRLVQVFAKMMGHSSFSATRGPGQDKENVSTMKMSLQASGVGSSGGTPDVFGTAKMSYPSSSGQCSRDILEYLMIVEAAHFSKTADVYQICWDALQTAGYIGAGRFLSGKFVA